jgi:hypothetical protein
MMWTNASRDLRSGQNTYVLARSIGAWRIAYNGGSVPTGRWGDPGILLDRGPPARRSLDLAHDRYLLTIGRAPFRLADVFGAKLHGKPAHHHYIYRYWQAKKSTTRDRQELNMTRRERVGVSRSATVDS